MSSPAGFFNRQELPVATPSIGHRTWVNVGGEEGDSWFRQIAAGIIDNVLSNPLANRALASRLMALHHDYISNAQPTRQLLRADERLRGMVSTTFGMEKMIHDLAFIFRQITVDAQAEDPEPVVFDNDYAVNSPAEMRKSAVKIHPAAIEALALRLQIPIKLSVVHSEEDAPLVEPFGPRLGKEESKGIVVRLRHQQGCYYSNVLQAEKFKEVRGMALMQQPPKQAINRPIDPELPVIRDRIRKKDELLFKTFNQYLHRLDSMVKAGELSKDQLLNVYIKSISYHPSPDCLNYAGTAHGTSQFFRALQSRVRPAPTHLAPREQKSHDDQLIHELTHALARGICLKQIDENLMYDQLEDRVAERTSARSA